MSKKLPNSSAGDSLWVALKMPRFPNPFGARVAILPGPPLEGDSVETIGGAENLALRLFLEIEKRYGEDEARRIFARRAKKPTKSELAEHKTWELLDRFDDMQPKPNVMQLARQLALENKSLPPEQQLTPRGSTTVATIEHHIRELIKKRKAKIAKGTWVGPPWTWGKLEKR